MIPINLPSFMSSDKLGNIYFQSICRSLGRSLIRLFIPAYLLSTGFTLGQIVLQYYILSYFIWTLASVVVIKIVGSFTTRTGFLLAALLGIIDSFLLFHMKELGVPLIAVAVCHGSSEAFFWTCYHFSFVTHSTVESRGRAISLIRILAKTGKVIGPTVGGWLLHDQQTTALLWLSSLLLLLSIAPMWINPQPELQMKLRDSSEPTNEDEKTQTFPANPPGRWDKDLVIWICLIGCGVEKSVGNSIWPLFCALAFFGERVHLFGMFSSAVLLFSLILTYAVGKFVDSNRSAPLLVGGGLSAMMWILRLFVVYPWQVAVVDTCYNWKIAMGFGEVLAWSCVYILLPATGPDVQVGAEGLPPVAPFSRWLFLIGVLGSSLQSALVAATTQPLASQTLSL